MEFQIKEKAIKIMEMSGWKLCNIVWVDVFPK